MTNLELPFDKEATDGLNFYDKKWPTAFNASVFIMTFPVWVLCVVTGAVLRFKAER